MRHLLETPFSEPLLRTLLRTLFHCKTHIWPPSQNPSENPSPELASAVPIYRMGNRSSAKIQGKWERKWKMAPGLKWPKNGRRNGKNREKWPKSHFCGHFSISVAIFRPFQAGGHFPFSRCWIFSPDRFPIDRLPAGQKVPPAQLHQRAAERNKPEVKGPEDQGAEPAAVPPPVQPVPAEGAPEPPLPPEGDEDEALPERELKLDGLIPPPLVKLHQRLSKRTELLKLHMKHYHMSSAQFRRRTSELYLPEGIYRLYDSVVKECETCQKTKPAPPRSRFSGVRAREFGDVVFMDHCEIKHMAKKHQLFLVLDGATSLLWGSTQQEGTEPVTQDLFREWMHIHSCKPKWVVADMAFFTPSWMTFWKTHGVKTMPTGRATPWPNRAETAVRLFKRQYEKLLMDASVHPALNKVTLRDLIRECCWARNTTLTISGYTPVELATGRRPTDHTDLELMKPDQLSAADLPRDATLNELRKLALKAHLEARQSADLRRDLARRVLPSDGPYAHGDRVFVWIDDKAKYKAVGRWARARVISQNGAIVTETEKAVLRVNQSKVRRDYDPWHDVPLPRNLDKPEKDVPLEPDDEPEEQQKRMCSGTSKTSVF